VSPVTYTAASAVHDRYVQLAPWILTARPALTWIDRLRLLVGVPLYVRFLSPDGSCSAACTITTAVTRTWPPSAQDLRLSRLTVAQRPE
jgi:hypothetical protein